MDAGIVRGIMPVHEMETLKNLTSLDLRIRRGGRMRFPGVGLAG